ncbi:hypothetical protein [Kibdelosporangium phytohabitans]|uniref:Histidine kinase n=1 Tax=Kibdelosporangium phytohabitans TaxID=860235 RepID=A0A0N9HW79_9PSEU|nr:hypothetical protein [Kibdelosporangium phytohabitans]ALG09544.1 histidine kinase [Kibdelosporangium phytohabitans]MBE1469143.1 hypothetical protein [Kibdelosporangium phytohabitans]
MDLTPYVDSLREELLAAAEPGEPTALAQRLASSVAAATRLTMFEVLAAATDEITRDLAPGSVEVRLRGREPVFVVTRPEPDERPEPVAEPEAPVPAVKDGAVSRINFRPPEQLKQRIEAAAAKEGLSTNAWLVRVASAALAGEQRTRRGRADGEFTGWVG